MLVKRHQTLDVRHKILASPIRSPTPSAIHHFSSLHSEVFTKECSIFYKKRWFGQLEMGYERKIGR